MKQSFFISLLLVTVMSFGAAIPTFILPNGTITIEGTIVTAVAGQGETIQEIQLIDASDQLVVKEAGCYSQSCNYDANELPSGGYTVVVITNEGSFSGPVQL